MMEVADTHRQMILGLGANNAPNVRTIANQLAIAGITSRYFYTGIGMGVKLVKKGGMEKVENL